jgi:hypothetical protein
MSKKERNSAHRRKNAADPNQPQKSGAAKPTYVSTDKPKKKVKESYLDERSLSKGETKEKERLVKGMKKSYKDFKARYGEDAKSVMYATATKMAKEETEIDEATYPSDFRNPDGSKRAVAKKKYGKPQPQQHDQKTDKYGRRKTVDEGTEPLDEKCWKGYTQKGMKKKGKKIVPNCVPVGEEKDHEVSMAQSQLSSAEKNIKSLKKKIGKKEKNLPAWMQAKITDTEHNMDAAAGYVTKEAAGEKDACYHKVKASAKVWPSAYASGRLVQCRKKGAANYGKSTKKESYVLKSFSSFLEEGAAWTKKAGKNSEGGLNEKGRKSYEAENPGSDLKAPSKKVGNPRRASFCARMKGMRKRQKPSNNTGDDRLSKSLRAWNC